MKYNLQADLFKTILTTSGFQQDYIILVLKEAENSIAHLQSIQTQDENEQSIRTFLKNRWAAICNSNISYTSFPHGPMNQICIKLAQSIAKPGESIAQILMPTITVTDYMIISDSLIDLTEDKDRNLKLTEFILNDNNTAIIPLKPWFETQTQNQSEFFNHLYTQNNATIPLSATEKERLQYSLMPASDDFFEEFNLRRKLVNTEGTLANEILKLCDGLRENGAAGKGNTFKAHDDVAIVIKTFSQALQCLPLQTKEKIFHLKAGNNRSFKYYWNIISGEEGKERDHAAETCVESNSSDLRNILNLNIEFLSSIKLKNTALDAAAPTTTSFTTLVDRLQAKLQSRQEAYTHFLEQQDLDSGQVALKNDYFPEPTQQQKLMIFNQHLSNPRLFTEFYPFKNIGEVMYAQEVLSAADFDKQIKQQDIHVIQKLLAEGFRLKKHAILASLVESREDILNTYTNNGETPLFFAAAENGVLEVLKVLLERKDIDLDLTDKYGNTALHISADCGHLDCVRYLLLKKLNFNHKNVSQINALWFAINRKHTEIAITLIQAGADISSKYDGKPLLAHAVSESWSNVVSALLERNDIDINESGTYGEWTALHYAAQDPNTDILKALIQKGADANVQNSYGATALHIAAEYGHVESVRCILALAKNLNLNLKNCVGRTALTAAIYHHYPDIAIALIQAGADISESYTEKTYFLTHATSKNWPHVVSALLERTDIQVNAVNDIGGTALHYAAADGSTEILKALIKKGAQINAQDNSGRTPLHLAARNGHLDCIQWLLAQKPLLNLKDSIAQYTALFFAIDNYHSRIATALIEAGADISGTHKGRPLLDYAINKNWINMAIAIIRTNPAVLNTTPLDELNTLISKIDLSDKHHIPVIKALIIAGADCPPSLNIRFTRSFWAAIPGNGQSSENKFKRKYDQL